MFFIVNSTIIIQLHYTLQTIEAGVMSMIFTVKWYLGIALFSSSVKSDALSLMTILCSVNSRFEKRCLLNIARQSPLTWDDAFRLRDVQPGKHGTLTQCWFNIGPSFLMLNQHWINIGSTSRVCWNLFCSTKIQWLLTQQTQNICTTFVQCWTNVEDVGPTLYKCYTDVLCLLGTWM